MKMKKVLREPLLHFLLIGGLLFLITSWINKEKLDRSQQIIIDDAIIQRIALQYQAQMGTLPPKQTLDAMINDYIRDEVYYREALKTGLDKDDEVIRRRLSQKYAFVQNDITADKAPSDEELQQFYADHTQLFRDSATVSFTHIYFSSDNSGSDAAVQRAYDVLKKLAVSETIGATQPGDPFPLQYHYSGITRLDAKETFGTTPFVDSLFCIPVRRWSKPVRSGYGWHLIYIQNRTDARVEPFNAVKGAVLQAWTEDQRRQANETNYKKVESQYTIVRKYMEEK
jgi:peptidyl-prolyl cis-trans isomerase C